VDIPQVQQLELWESCSSVCLETRSDTQRGLEICVEEQVQERGSCQGDGGDGGGDGGGGQPEVEEQD